jgi:putative transposase
MPKQLNYSLTEEELGQIREAMKSSTAEVAKRANIVHNLYLGYAPQEVAQQHNISLGTVYNQFNRFKAEGVAGLPNKPKSGRRPKANKAFRHRLIQVVETAPSEFGYGFSVWTLPSLQAFMERETGISLSQNRLSEVLQEEGYVYRRPKKDLGHQQDIELREQVKQALDEFKKTPETRASGYSLWMKVDSV